MGNLKVVAGIKPRSAEISAVVIRADGRREELGTIAYYHRNPLRRFVWRVKQFFKGVYNGAL